MAVGGPGHLGYGSWPPRDNGTRGTPEKLLARMAQESQTTRLGVEEATSVQQPRLGLGRAGSAFPPRQDQGQLGGEEKERNANGEETPREGATSEGSECSGQVMATW